MSIRQLTATSQYRVHVVLGEPASTYTPNILVATNWSITRVDNAGGVSLSVTFAFQTDLTSLDLALSGPLVPGVPYTVSESPAGSGIVSWLSPASQTSGSSLAGDPEAEAFGVDVDWLATSLTPSGDMPEIRGLDCLKNDLVAIAKTDPSELFHRPKEGAGLLSKVNGPGSDTDEVARSLRPTWQRDARVRSVKSLTVSSNSSGGVTASADIETVALSGSLQVTVRT